MNGKKIVEMNGRYSMTLKTQSKNNAKLHKLTEGKYFFGIGRVFGRYFNRHMIFKRKHQRENTNLYGAKDLPYGKGKLEKKERWY